MLLPGDAAVVHRDRELAALPVLLDDAALGVHLRGCWTSDLDRPDVSRVTYLRYKPGTMVVAAVETVTRDVRDVRMLVATSASARAKLDKLGSSATRHGIPMLAADDDLRLLLLPVEADRHLPGLRRLEDRVGWLDRDLRRSRLRVLAYKPHRRYVARIEVDGVATAVVKVHQPRAAGRPLAALRWASEVAVDRVPLPRLVAADTDMGVAVTAWSPGAALHEQDPDRRRATLRAVGKALGRLHQLDPNGLSEAPTPERAPLVEAIRQLRPDLAAIAGTIDDAAGSCTQTPVHGDLSPDQVVHGSDGIAVIDLDRAGRGCPATDLASWIAASIVEAPAGPPDARVPEPLLEGYRSVDGPATIAHVLQHLPIELLRRATDPFRHRRADWSASMARIVGFAADTGTEVGAA